MFSFIINMGLHKGGGLDIAARLDWLASVSMGVLGGLAGFLMLFLWYVRGSPWLPIPLLPGYLPHAYKIVEWVAFYFVVLRPRFGARAFPAFMASYGFLEVFFNSVYLATHGGPHFGVYPYLDLEYPLRLAAYAGTFIIGVWLGRVKASLPSKANTPHWLLAWVKGVVIGYFVYEEFGAIFVHGYNVVLNVPAQAWTWAQTWNDLFSNTMYLLALWALVYPRSAFAIHRSRNQLRLRQRS